MRTFPAALLIAILPTAVFGQATATSPHDRALVAGYKAAFLCSGLFNAGQSPEEVAADDLTRIYPEYRPVIADLPVEIDREERRVSVAWSETMPPRIAQWRPRVGCTQLPIGADPAMAAALRAAPATVTHDTIEQIDALPWPRGDKHAVRALPAERQVALDSVIAAGFDRATYGETTETTAVLVVQDGGIVGERYRTGYDMHRPQRTWSVAKSIAASVIGAAVERGMLDIEDPAPVPEWQAEGDPRAAIRWTDLMHMSSGLWSPTAGNRTDDIYFGGMAVGDSLAGLPLEAAPGTRWRYANNDTMAAMRALHAVIGEDAEFLAFPFTELLLPIGMTRTTPEIDWRGDFVLSSQVWTTARDLARLGMLYLADGVWEGERILPEGWADYVATPAPDQPEGRGDVGYGAQFWLFGREQGLPEGTYAAMGNRGQYVVIVPARKTIVVRRGFDAVGEDKNFDVARFAADILAALSD